MLRWATDFLSDRKQKVVMEAQRWEWTKVCSSIPQGSVLGPILFLLFVSAFFDCVKSYYEMRMKKKCETICEWHNIA